MNVLALIDSLWPILADVIPRVARIAVFVTVGVFLANVAVGFGLVERIAVISKYLTRPANLPDEVGTAIVTTAASTTAGYGMLADFRESGRLSDIETLIAVTMNTFFGFVQHIFTFYAPVLIPILGARVGFLYVGARAAIALGISIVGVLAGAVLLGPTGLGSNQQQKHTTETTPDSLTEPEPGSEKQIEANSTTTNNNPRSDGGPVATDDNRSTQAVLRTAGEKTWSKTRRIVPRLAIIYVLITIIIETQDLREVTAIAEPLTAVLGLPGAALPVVAVFAFDTTAGAATIAPMVGPTFTSQTAVATMLLGGIVSFAVSTFKRSIPFQYGIWGPTFGSKVIIVNTVLKIIFITAALAVLLV
ncbi:hypothetical protein [Haloquadratum walsbyi]|uniref:Uncharacterized protein conserved in archaea n=1 Tax=Haloquadratum walsbyi J07HQW2 TaxID=1238425 RepID=U1NES9_9EURY|nr:hypothetical protein [Haloquadratum walsbyi]ERG95273.1 MAG: uncharacterized protein conserved in archaea [Haloquadratum walsbyi J07HQW2]